MCKLTIEYDIKKIIKSVFLLSEEEYVKLPCYDRSLLAKICKMADGQHVDMENNYQKDLPAVDDDLSPQQSNDLVINIVIRNDMSFNQDLVDNDITEDLALYSYYDFGEDLSELNYNTSFTQNTDWEEPRIFFDDPANVILITPKECDSVLQIESMIDKNEHIPLQNSQSGPELPSFSLCMLNSQLEENFAFCEAENNVTSEKFSNEMNNMVIKFESDELARKDHLRFKNNEAAKKYRMKKKEHVQQLHDTMQENGELRSNKLARYHKNNDYEKNDLARKKHVQQLEKESILKKNTEQSIQRPLFWNETDALITSTCTENTITNIPHGLCFNETPTEELKYVPSSSENVADRQLQKLIVIPKRDLEDQTAELTFNGGDSSALIITKDSENENVLEHQLHKYMDTLVYDKEHIKYELALIGGEPNTYYDSNDFNTIGTISLEPSDSFSMNPAKLNQIKFKKEYDKRQRNMESAKKYRMDKKMHEQQLYESMKMLKKDKENLLQELASLGDDTNIPLTIAEELALLGDDAHIPLKIADHDDIDVSASLELEHCKQTYFRGKDRNQQLIIASKRYRMRKKIRLQEMIKSMKIDQELVHKLKERIEMLRNEQL